MTAASAPPLARVEVAETLRYLARRPYENAYVHWLLATGRTAPGEIRVWRDDDGRLGGVCYAGAQIVPIVSDERAIAAFATAIRDERFARTIAGARVAVEPLWAAIRDAWRAPRLVRESQPLYALDRKPPAAAAGVALDVGRATLAEAGELAEQSGRMIAGEIGGSAERLAGPLRQRVEAAIAEGRWWRAREAGRLAFMVNVGAELPATAQLSGVWSPVEMRGRGLATVALAEIARRLLGEQRSLSLYVNDFNAAAIALYERVGFRRVGEFRTILF